MSLAFFAAILAFLCEDSAVSGIDASAVRTYSHNLRDAHFPRERLRESVESIPVMFWLSERTSFSSLVRDLK
ncbi:hypothetical protein BJY52DRAFT_1244164, partial [Lactarius psammicola]